MKIKTLSVNLSRQQDPTGQAQNRKRLNKKISSRLDAAEKEVKSLFKRIPATPRRESNLSLNQDSFTVYDYDIATDQLDMLMIEIEQIIDNWLLEGLNRIKPLDFYSDPNVEEAARAGTLETVRDINSILAAAAAAGALAAMMPRSIQTETILFSADYSNTVNEYQSGMFSDIRGLSEKTSSQVYERILTGMQGNKTPREIIKDITKRFDVSESSAKRIVQTQVNKINNDARMKTIDFINANTPLNAAGQHISALLSTTRKTHADRHEKIYTPAQQRRWWDQGSNRINCYCSFKPVLLDDDNSSLGS